MLIQHVGKVKGHFSSKENRAAKIIDMWDDLQAKMERMVVKGKGRTEQARHAYAVLCMMHTGIRVGNEGSAEGWVSENQRLALKDDPERVNPFSGVKGIKEGDVIWRSPYFGQLVQTFGLTTLLCSHVEVRKGKGPSVGVGQIVLSFTGKKMVEQELVMDDPIMVRFAPPKGLSTDLWLDITYPSLKRFVKRFVGSKFSPKDIRTARVNLLFCELWEGGYAPAFDEATRKSDKKRVVSACVEDTAERIGHTKGVCRSSYLSTPMLQHLLDMMEAERTRTSHR